MGLLTRIVQPLVPRSIRRKVREARIRREIRTWQDLDLHRDLTGLRVKVSSRSDWTVFNEIFVEGFYDRAIAHVLNQVPVNRMLHVLDLGANVGFFALRFSQMVFQSDHPDRPFFIHCVEGSPRVYEDLAARVVGNPRLKGHIETVHGLIGQRSGSTKIYQSSFGAGNSTIPQHWSTPVTVSYVDLYALVHDGPIALLKCDIEGSEQTFQNQYHELLQRTDAAVVELHHKYISPSTFCQGMRALGFAQQDVLWASQKDQEPASLVLFRH
jgi:FkbM family methyltransferase